MDRGQEIAKKRAFVLFVSYLCMALVCFGIFAYLVIVKRGEGAVSDRLITVSQIIVFVGIFFLILAFVHILPSLFAHNKICSEANMRQALGKYIPCGETLLAGIYATVQESSVTAVFGKCRCMEGRLVPDEAGGTLALIKRKVLEYEIYLGITQSYLLIGECGKNRHAYQCVDGPDVREEDVKELTSELLWEDIGTSFPLEDVQSCEVRKGLMGAILCTLTMKNGTYFKLTLPDNAGPNADMPHHTRYREMILARLGGVQVVSPQK